MTCLVLLFVCMYCMFKIDFDTWDIDSLWRNLSFGTKTFDLVTVTLNFELVLKNFDLDYIFWTRCVRALIFEV
jgi:hypothetical protein